MKTKEILEQFKNKKKELKEWLFGTIYKDYDKEETALVVQDNVEEFFTDEWFEELCSTLRQSVLEEVREKMPKQRTENDDELSARDNVENEGFNRCHDQVTSLINELAEEEK